MSSLLAASSLRFSYGVRPVINNINLRVEPQQTVAFVGATGSGKSTLFQLLTRFYDPTAGDVMFDGHPITHYAKASVRDAISYVTQDSFLFARNISKTEKTCENILNIF